MAPKLPKVLIVTAVICCGIAGGIYALKRGLQHAQESRATTFVFDVTEDVLTEELALKYAKTALADCEGAHSLEPLEDDRATAPDRFLVRNTIDNNRGYILFEAENATTNRCVWVSVAEDKLTCTVTLPK